MSTTFRLAIPRFLHDAILAHAQAEQPLECCGLLAGVREGALATIVAHHPLVNALASPTEYETEAKSLLHAYRAVDQMGLDVLAFYHSHPTSAPLPSKKDLDRATWEGVVYLIISLVTSPPEMRGWWLSATEYHEAEMEILE